MENFLLLHGSETPYRAFFNENDPVQPNKHHQVEQRWGENCQWPIKKIKKTSKFIWDAGQGQGVESWIITQNLKYEVPNRTFHKNWLVRSSSVSQTDTSKRDSVKNSLWMSYTVFVSRHRFSGLGSHCFGLIDTFAFSTEWSHCAQCVWFIVAKNLRKNLLNTASMSTFCG